MTFELTLIGLSDQGRVRSRNEDSFRVRPDSGLAVVADGMGGHPAGAEASALAVETFVHHLLEASVSDAPILNGDWGERMAESVEQAHHRLVEEGTRNPARRGMGTTLTALHVDRDSGHGTLVHVGDSRAYRLRDGRLTRLTRDHTWVQEQVEAGYIEPAFARMHPMAHVLTRVLGGMDAAPAPEVRTIGTRLGDLFLLCTDGLTTHLTDDIIHDILSAESDSTGALATSLVAAANDRGGTDNVTVVLLVVGETAEGSR
jgi:protein phosphatase